MSRYVELRKHATPMIVTGHKLIHVQRESQYGDARWHCECGSFGEWLDSARQARDDHRDHKLHIRSLIERKAAGRG